MNLKEEFNETNMVAKIIIHIMSFKVCNHQSTIIDHIGVFVKHSYDFKIEVCLLIIFCLILDNNLATL